MYQCETCGYQTENAYRFKQHVNRKTPCKKTDKTKKSNDHEASCSRSTHQQSTSHSTSNSHGNDVPDVEQIMKDVNDSIQNSLQNVDGLSSTTTSSSTTNTNIKNNNIYINCFGKDDLLFLLGDNHIINKLEHYSPDGVYALIRLDDAHNFNRMRSIEQIKSTDKFLKYVRDPLDKYVDVFKHILKGEDIVLNKVDDQIRIKKLLSILLTVGGMMSDDISRKLELYENEGILETYGYDSSDDSDEN
jgi:hypothetical protein